MRWLLFECNASLPEWLLKQMIMYCSLHTWQDWDSVQKLHFSMLPGHYFAMVHGHTRFRSVKIQQFCVLSHGSLWSEWKHGVSVALCWGKAGQSWHRRGGGCRGSKASQEPLRSHLGWGGAEGLSNCLLLCDNGCSCQCRFGWCWPGIQTQRIAQ